MRDAAIFDAVKEAQRFLKAAEAWHERQRQEKAKGLNGASTTRQSGAVRRASMDLSRALADMRRS